MRVVLLSSKNSGTRGVIENGVNEGGEGIRHCDTQLSEWKVLLALS